MRPVCVEFTQGVGVWRRDPVRVEEWNYQRFRENKLQRVLMRLTFIFTSCKKVNIE